MDIVTGREIAVYKWLIMKRITVLHLLKVFPSFRKPTLSIQNRMILVFRILF